MPNQRNTFNLDNRIISHVGGGGDGGGDGEEEKEDDDDDEAEEYGCDGVYQDLTSNSLDGLSRVHVLPL